MKYMTHFKLVDGDELYLYDDDVLTADSTSMALASNFLRNNKLLSGKYENIGKCEILIWKVTINFTKLELQGLVRGDVNDKLISIYDKFEKKDKLKKCLEFLFAQSTEHVLDKLNQNANYFNKVISEFELEKYLRKLDLVFYNGVFVPEFLVGECVKDIYVINVTMENKINWVTTNGISMIQPSDKNMGVLCNGTIVNRIGEFEIYSGITTWEICSGIYVEANADRSNVIVRKKEKCYTRIFCLSVNSFISEVNLENLKDITQAEILVPKQEFHRSFGEHFVYTCSNPAHKVYIIIMK